MNKKIVVLGVLVLLWMAFIYFMSEMDSDDSDDRSRTVAMEIVHKYDKITKAKNETILKHHTKEFINKANHVFRKISHAFVYFILALLVFAFLLALNKNTIIICILINLFICFFYACTDEYHQTFIRGRTGQFSDVLIDTCGALVGCIIFVIFYKIIKKVKK